MSHVINGLTLAPELSSWLPFGLQANYFTLAFSALAVLLILTLHIRLRRILTIPIWLFNLPIYFLSGLLPKNHKRWLFTCRQGTAFAENSKYLFQYVVSNHKDIDAIWITKSDDVFRELKHKGYKVCKAHSPAGYWYSMTAGALFVSHNRIWKPDGNGFAVSPGTLIMQLWHGSPIKRLGDTVENSKQSPLTRRIGMMLTWIFPFLVVRTSCHRMLAACPQVANHLRDSYNLLDANMLISGYPKNDRWLERSMRTTKAMLRKVIFMPTFRSADWRIFLEFDFDINRLDKVCRENNIEFHIKLHPYSLARIEPIMKNLSGLSHVKYCADGDIYEILDQFDVLVTDYSSISFDYLLCGRPIIFAPFDYETYKNEERGFLEDYSSLTPGPKARNWRELEDILMANQDNYIEQRHALNDRYNTYQSYHSCQQLVEATQSLLQKNVGKEKPRNHNQY
jgi:CDP-glycerol glycerophosphotransferase (TagB/SpsB family)